MKCKIEYVEVFFKIIIILSQILSNRIETSMLNLWYLDKKYIPIRLTLWKAWVGFKSVGFGFDKWIWILRPPIWYVCLENTISVENGLWWIAQRAQWVNVV
jgi:hypothetical protein